MAALVTGFDCGTSVRRDDGWWLKVNLYVVMAVGDTEDGLCWETIDRARSKEEAIEKAKRINACCGSARVELNGKVVWQAQDNDL